MARRKTIHFRRVNPDPVYKDRLVTKLVNRSMKDGKKTVVQKEVYRSFEIVEKVTGKPGIEMFMVALENIKPTVEVKARRVGGAAYQVPVSVRGVRREALAIRWLIQSARLRSASELKTYAEKLAAEIMDAYKNEGGAIRKKEEMHRMAEANKAFAHFRW